MRVIIAVPKEVYDDFRGSYFTDDEILNYVYSKQIPAAYLFEEDNFFMLTINSACKNCDCQDRIRKYKVEKEDIDHVLTTQLVDSVILIDAHV